MTFSGKATTAAVSLVLVIAACIAAPAPQPDLDASEGTASSGSAPGSTSAIPSVLPGMTAASLPNPGGSCTAGQLVVTSSPVAFPGYAALGYALVFVQQKVRNAGEGCVLNLPEAIGVAAGAEDLRAVLVKISINPATVDIAPGRSISLVLGASWWLGVSTDGGSAFPTPPCEGRISDVSRVEFPLSSGRIEIGWDRSWAWRDVCITPPNVTVTVDGLDGG